MTALVLNFDPSIPNYITKAAVMPYRKLVKDGIITIYRFRKFYTAMSVMVTLLFGLWIAKAQAMTCGPRHELKKQLIEIFHEKPVAMGIVSEKVLMQIYVSEFGTWTISLTNTEGISCIVAEGSKFQFRYKKMYPKA